MALNIGDFLSKLSGGKTKRERKAARAARAAAVAQAEEAKRQAAFEVEELRRQIPVQRVSLEDVLIRRGIGASSIALQELGTVAPPILQKKDEQVVPSVEALGRFGRTAVEAQRRALAGQLGAELGFTALIRQIKAEREARAFGPIANLIGVGTTTIGGVVGGPAGAAIGAQVGAQFAQQFQSPAAPFFSGAAAGFSFWDRAIQQQQEAARQGSFLQPTRAPGVSFGRGAIFSV